MAFALKRKKKVAKQLRHILDLQLTTVAACVADDGRLTDKEIHSARKAIKRARATLRLFRPATPRVVFSGINMALRDVARPLTAIRDTTALHNALDALQSSGAQIDSDVIARLRQRLNTQRLKTRRRLNGSGAMPHLRAALQTLQRDAQRLKPDARDWQLLSPALRQIYRRARRAYITASAVTSDENLHEWRKRVKQLGYSLKLLIPMRRERIGAWAEVVQHLSELLGDDHDLANLTAWLGAQPLSPASEAPLALIIERRRQALQERSFGMGEYVFAQRPQRFIRSLRGLWRDWHQPDASESTIDRIHHPVPRSQWPQSVSSDDASRLH